MVTWLCHLIRSFTANFIQKFHVATVYIDVSRALDQQFNQFVFSPSHSPMRHLDQYPKKRNCDERQRQGENNGRQKEWSSSLGIALAYLR